MTIRFLLHNLTLSLLLPYIRTRTKQSSRRRRRKIRGTAEKKMTAISDLTIDLLMDIMTRLEVKHIMRCRCVSKPWRSLLTNNPTFIRLYFDRSNLRPPNLLVQALDHLPDYTKQFKTLTYPDFINVDECLNLNIPLHEKVEVLGSCNGIFCLLDQEFICLWNPSTREHTEIAFDEKIFNSESVTFGFGFDSATDEYKLVVIELDGDFSTREVTVFSTGTNSWKKMGVGPPYSCIINNYETGIHVNGVLHWLGVFTPYVDSIISFDLKTESFGEIPWPDDSDNNYHHSVDDFVLGVMNERLVIYYFFSNNFCVERVDVWKMEVYGVKESWIRAFSIQEGIMVEKGIAPLFILKNGELLLARGGRDLVLYDPVAKTGRVIIRGVFEIFDVYTYMEALTPIPLLVAGNKCEE